MVRGTPPKTLPLDEVRLSATDSSIKYCHTYGVFLEENKKVWKLADETCVRGIEITLNGKLDTYPKPLPGDIVRIHRLTCDISRQPTIPLPINVVLWRSFLFEPVAITTAKQPTLTEEDTHRRRILETFYCSTLDKLATTLEHGNFYNVCGRVENIGTSFDNILLELNDGTGKSWVRVFKPIVPIETNLHFETASKLKTGDLVVVTNVKCYSHAKTTTLDLSSNLNKGKSIRVVESNSILGTKLKESLNIEKEPNGIESDIAQQSARNTQKRQNSQESQPLRRSARLNNNTPNQSQEQPSNADEEEEIPKYTMISDIKREDNSFYNFYNIAGQVHGKPILNKYGHWVLQLCDGSRLNFSCYDDQMLEQKIPNCATIIVYSKQKPFDTDEHVEKVKKLEEGQLVFIKNIKASWRDDKLRLELNANLQHGKSINLINVTSRFGIMLLNIVTRPPNEEFDTTQEVLEGPT